jgi:hypothetical protein
MLYEVIIQNSLAILLICGIPRVLFEYVKRNKKTNKSKNNNGVGHCSRFAMTGLILGTTAPPAAYAQQQQQQPQPQNEKPNHIQWAFLVEIENPDGDVETHQIHTETKKGCEEFRLITAEQPRVISVGECYQINLKKL